MSLLQAYVQILISFKVVNDYFQLWLHATSIVR